MNRSAPFEISIILSFEIVSDFGFRASDFIIPLTNIAENLAKNTRLFFIVIRMGTDKHLRHPRNPWSKTSRPSRNTILCAFAGALFFAEQIKNIWNN